MPLLFGISISIAESNVGQSAAYECYAFDVKPVIFWETISMGKGLFLTKNSATYISTQTLSSPHIMLKDRCLSLALLSISINEGTCPSRLHPVRH